MNRVASTLLRCFVAASFAIPAAATASSDVVEEVLPNGMKVLVREDHKAPVVISNLWVKVGSNDETPGVAGCSHLIEHLIFNKGTAKRGVGDLAREVLEAGGEHNAGTGYESTNYFITLPSENFDVALDLQSDALTSSVFDPAELDKEREVVIEENNLYADEPAGYGNTWNKLLAAAFDAAPYKHPIGGTDDAIRAATREDILSYKNRFYVPSNMTLVVVGDIDARDVLRKVRAAYKNFSGPPAPARSHVREPEQTAFRYLAYSGDLSQAYLKFGYHIPGEIAPDAPALRVLGQLLAQGRSGRIHRSVREEQGLISSIELLSETGPEEGYLVFDVVSDVENTARAEEAVLREIEKMKQGLVSEGELSKAKHQVVSGYVFSLETVDGQASNLGFYDAMGDYTYALRYPDLVNAVTAEEVRDAARRYFGLENLTLSVYYPAASEGKIETGTAAVRARLEGAVAGAPAAGMRRGEEDATVGAGSVRPAPREATPGSEARERTPKADGGEHTVFGWLRTHAGSFGQRVFGKNGSSRSGAAERIDFPNGLVLLVEENPSVPVATLGVFVRAGTRNETPETNGIAPLAVRVMLKGTRTRNAEAIAEEMESLGGVLSPFSSADVSGCTMSILSSEFEKGFDIVEDVLENPVFEGNETAREREIMKSEIEAQKDNTVVIALEAFRKLVYGAHPYGMPLLGTAGNLDRLGPADLARWHESYYAPNNMLICVSGDVRASRVRDLVGRSLGRLPRRPVPAAPAIALPESQARFEVVEKDVSQDVLIVGGAAPCSSHPDGRVMEVIQGALEGSGNRLFTELRDKKSLCYYTGLFYHANVEAGTFGGYIGTAPSKEADARAALSEELRRVAKEGLTAEEIRRSQNTLIGNEAIAMQSNGARVERIADDYLSGRGFDASAHYAADVRAVDAGRISAALTRYFDLDRAAIVVVRPPQP